VFAVVVTGPPGAGKTVCVTALSDLLAVEEVAHAAVDVDEVAWAYPYPDDEQRCAYLGAACEAHRRAGHELLLVAEVVESAEHLRDVLAAVAADDHLLVRLEAELPTLRERIVAREPPDWSSLDYLLGETDRLVVEMAELDGVHLVLDSERLGADEIAARIRSALPG
jgi:broad-specificity NMP kinase